VNSHAQIKIQYKCKGGQCQIRYDKKIWGGGKEVANWVKNFNELKILIQNGILKKIESLNLNTFPLM
jgi:hypothetical protein